MLTFFKSGYQKIKNALSKTTSVLGSRLRALFSKPLDDNTFEQLEQILYEADLGTVCAANFVELIQGFCKKNPGADYEEILKTIQGRALEILTKPAKVFPVIPNPGDPLVILVVGVNGSGKTTSIAKLAKLFKDQGKKVLLGAGDTFRAAAIDQLDTWSQRVGVEIVKAKPHSDPSSVAFDAISAAKARNVDIVLIDTAGRLQNKTDLMQELEKIKRVCKKVVPSAPHEILLVLDATVGQNAIDQAKTFNEFTPITGIILAKLDGSAKGGIALAIYEQLGIPVRWIGVGESAQDFMPFDAQEYVDALFKS